MDCSSPMSMNIEPKTGSSDISDAGTGNPHWNMYCTMPVVFRQTDLPPALGPDMTRMRLRLSSCMFSGTISRPCARRVCCSSGWRASLSTSLSSVETMGFTQPFAEAQRPLARSMSTSAR